MCASAKRTPNSLIKDRLASLERCRFQTLGSCHRIYELESTSTIQYLGKWLKSFGASTLLTYKMRLTLIPLIKSDTDMRITWDNAYEMPRRVPGPTQRLKKNQLTEASVDIINLKTVWSPVHPSSLPQNIQIVGFVCLFVFNGQEIEASFYKKSLFLVILKKFIQSMNGEELHALRKSCSGHRLHFLTSTLTWGLTDSWYAGKHKSHQQ